MTSISLGLGLIAVALVVATGTPGAGANYDSAQATRGKVTSLLGIQYSVKRCNGDTAFKINAVSRRWHRMKKKRRVKAGFITRAEGPKCNGDPIKATHDRRGMRPCFGCDGNTGRWTPDYFSQYLWPYVRQAHIINNSVGAVVVSKVKNRRTGRNLGIMCVKIALAGHMDSSLC